MKQIELLVLAAAAERPAHGYAIAQEITELTDGRVKIRPGNLYRVIERLEQRGLLRETGDPSSGGADERRRYFTLTAAGRRAAAAELRLYADVLARTPSLKRRPASA